MGSERPPTSVEREAAIQEAHRAYWKFVGTDHDPSSMRGIRAAIDVFESAVHQRAGEGEPDCERCDGSGRESQDDGLMLTEGDCVACGGSGSAPRAGEPPTPDGEAGERMELIARYAAADAQPDCPDCEGGGIDYEGDEWTLCDGPSCALVTLRAREARAAPDAARQPNRPLLSTDDSEIAVVPDAQRKAWEPKGTGYSREDFERDRAARQPEGER